MIKRKYFVAGVVKAPGAKGKPTIVVKHFSSGLTTRSWFAKDFAGEEYQKRLGQNLEIILDLKADEVVVITSMNRV
jgi:hypothetical protein